MRNIRLQCSYDGSAFFGWQRQEGFVSVQEAIEDAVLATCGQRVVVQGSGRTDTGVHALGQVANFHVETRLSDEKLRNALNAHSPVGVAVNRLETCADSFHSRFDAIGKRYLYLCLTTRFKPAMLHKNAHWVRSPLDADSMRQAAKILEGEHDFRAFASSGGMPTSTVRKLGRVRIIARRSRFCVIVDGSGFLYNMVRTIAGTLIAVGRGRMSVEDVARALASRERSQAGPTAPACGLYMLRVRYPEPVFSGPDPSPYKPAGLFLD